MSPPVGLYILIRVLPSLLTASTNAIVFRELALIMASLAWLIWLARHSPLSAGAMGLVRPKLGDLGWGIAATLATLVISVSASMFLRRLLTVEPRTRS